MSPDLLFRILNLAVLPAWLLLAIAPRWRHTQTVVFSVTIAVLSALYLLLVGAALPESEGGFDSLPGVAKMFESHWVLLAGWVHYLAFDLFVGAWEVRDARRLRIPQLAVIPCLLLTLMLGPAGWLCYFMLRGVVRRQLLPDEPVS